VGISRSLPLKTFVKNPTYAPADAQYATVKRKRSNDNRNSVIGIEAPKIKVGYYRKKQFTAYIGLHLLYSISGGFGR
jgi:hypothetical protein